MNPWTSLMEQDSFETRFADLVQNISLFWFQNSVFNLTFRNMTSFDFGLEFCLFVSVYRWEMLTYSRGCGQPGLIFSSGQNIGKKEGYSHYS